ncbi:integumentary mucin C.1-like [Culex pipiens pallens]|uniref:integumentary mucin C.1-like n=1 Tax=Culex pipiens pallens TaxID=42434 RepID=UPI00195438D3|nr:integumentary mucin C.1-like [Culex pipiens pallens]
MLVKLHFLSSLVLRVSIGAVVLAVHLEGSFFIMFMKFILLVFIGLLHSSAAYPPDTDSPEIPHYIETHLQSTWRQRRCIMTTSTSTIYQGEFTVTPTTTVTSTITSTIPVIVTSTSTVTDTITPPVFTSTGTITPTVTVTPIPSTATSTLTATVTTTSTSTPALVLETITSSVTETTTLFSTTTLTTYPATNTVYITSTILATATSTVTIPAAAFLRTAGFADKLRIKPTKTKRNPGHTKTSIIESFLN